MKDLAEKDMTEEELNEELRINGLTEDELMDEIFDELNEDNIHLLFDEK